MPKMKRAARTSRKAWTVEWQLVVYLAVGALMAPIAYFGADALAASTSPVVVSEVAVPVTIATNHATKPPCPFDGWGTGGCIVDSFTMSSGKHYAFSGLKEVSATSPEADIGWTAESSGYFFNRYGTDAYPMAYDATPQADYSFASIWYGGTGDIFAVACPKFELVKVTSSSSPRYTYLEGVRKTDGTIDWSTSSKPTISVGNVYCIVNHDNTMIVKMKVLSLSTSTGKITVQLKAVESTGVKTYGCADGFCTTDVRDYCVGCSLTDKKLMTTDFNIRTTVKKCVDGKLKPAISRPTIRQFFPDTLALSTGESGSTTYSEGLASRSYGFEGIINPGETKVTSPTNIRISQHEMMHQYNNVFISGKIKSWLDEGLAIAMARHLGTSCSRNTFDDAYRQVTYASVKSGQKDPAGLGAHSLGSLFFEGLETDYACGGTCIYKVWGALQKAYKGYNVTTQPTLTIAGIRSAIQTDVGIDVQPLLTLLKITDSTP
jgi:hypothetical protein